MDNFNEDEISFWSWCVDGKQSKDRILDKQEPTSSLHSDWPNTSFQQFNSNTYAGTNILHPISTVPGPTCSSSNRVINGPRFGEYQDQKNRPKNLHPMFTIPGPYRSPSNIAINGPSFGEYQSASQQPIAISQNRANGPTVLHPISTLPGLYHSHSTRIINEPSSGEEYQRVSQQPTTFTQNMSWPIPPSTCVSERATEATSGYRYTNFLPSRCISGSYQSPSGTVLRSTEFNQNTMRGTLRSSVKHLPSSSITGERNILGTKSTPIQISDSPIRENTPVQYERTYCSQRGKRDRSVEVEILHPIKKKNKILHEPETQNMRRLPYPSQASFINSPASTSDESNLSPIKSGTNSQTKTDGMKQVDGCIIIPIGEDLILDELLCTYGYSSESDLPSLPPGPDVWCYNHMIL